MEAEKIMEKAANKAVRARTRKVVLLFASALVALVFSSEVALAMETIQCKTYRYGSPACKGTKAAERLLGTDGPHQVYALGGNDVLKGFGERDDLFGNPGNDKMVGGAGQDWLMPGTGNDTNVAGGEVNDVYQFISRPSGAAT